jgi:signal transduction histidine kinase
MNDSFDRLLAALEDERRYMARELHDGVAQTTLQLGLQVGICKKLLERGNLELLAGELARLEERIQVASGQVRDMIADLRPPLIDPGEGINTYLKYLVDIHTQRGGPPVAYQFDWPEQQGSLTPQQTLALARVVQEALLNIRKHAQAENVRMILSTEAGGLYMSVADNGQGFDVAEVQARPTDKGGAGLANLHAQVEAVGGSLAISRKADGWTEIMVRLPK